jgi:hypothetical protein
MWAYGLRLPCFSGGSSAGNRQIRAHWSLGRLHGQTLAYPNSLHARTNHEADEQKLLDWVYKVTKDSGRQLSDVEIPKLHEIDDHVWSRELTVDGNMRQRSRLKLESEPDFRKLDRPGRHWQSHPLREPQPFLYLACAPFRISSVRP